VTPLEYAKWAGILVAALALFGGGFYVGRLGIEVHDDKQVIVNQAQEQKRATTNSAIISEEGKTYANAVAAAVAAPDPAPAVVCVRRYANPVQAGAAAAPRVEPDGGGGLPGGDYQPVHPITDIGGPASAIGARANAQVAGLHDYITRVCLAP
jgi:hypothetical protein